MTTLPESEVSLEEKVKQLEAENKKLRKKVDRLKKTMEITSRHGDILTVELEEKVEESIREIEEHVRLISETIPVPVIISQVSGAKILYVNEHSCGVFGYAPDELINCKAFELYENPDDRQKFLKELTEQGTVANFEMKLKKKNGDLFWGALFSKPLNFKNEQCVLTVIYDLTDSRKAEDEIRRLREQLDQKESSYLIFILDGMEYGIDISEVTEILRMMPISPVPNAPEFWKGVITLRNKLIPIIDLRLRLCLKTTDYTDQTCIIVVETREEKIMFGMIVDSVREVMRIKGRDIAEPPDFGLKVDVSFISGMAKTKSEAITILIETKHILGTF